MIGRFKEIVELLPKDEDLDFLRTASCDIVNLYKQHVGAEARSVTV